MKIKERLKKQLKKSKIHILLAVIILCSGFILEQGLNAQTYLPFDNSSSTNTGTSSTNSNSSSTNQTGTTNSSTIQITSRNPNFPPMILTVDDFGKILIRGTVQSVASDYIMVRSWGGDWKIEMGSTTQMISKNINYVGNNSEISIGDFVGLTGIIDQNAPFAINADFVRDWTKSLNTTSDNNPNLYTGTVSDLSNNSFILTNENGSAYMVNIDQNTKVLNTRRETINFSEIQLGDSIRINGTTIGNVISATVVRDTSK
jgi:hypothetical protein